MSDPGLRRKSRLLDSEKESWATQHHDDRRLDHVVKVFGRNDGDDVSRKVGGVAHQSDETPHALSLLKDLKKGLTRVTVLEWTLLLGLWMHRRHFFR